MTTGSLSLLPGQIWERYTNDGGGFSWLPYGNKLSRTWSGNDGGSNYQKVVMMVPREPYIKSVRLRDGRVILRTVYKPPKRVIKRVKFRKYRPPNAFSNDNRRWVYGALYMFCGKKPYVNESVWKLVQIPYIGPYPGLSIDANDQLALIGKLSARIQDTDFSAAIAFAETDKTLKMIADRAKNLAKSLAYLRKGNFREALRVVSGYARPDTLKLSEKELLKAGRTLVGSTAQHTTAVVGARILEVQYGWKPLINDVYEGAVWLAALQSKPNAMRYSVRKRRITHCENSGAGIWFSNPTSESRRQIIAYLEESSFAPTLNLWNPAEILWERTPYSFVVDWFIPIGQYLAARGVSSKLSGTFVTTDTLRKRSGTSQMMSPQGTPEYTKLRTYIDNSAIPPFWSEDFVVRSISTTLSVPKPVFKGLGQSLSWQHCLNAVSLLAVANRLKPDDVLRSAGRL